MAKKDQHKAKPRKRERKLIDVALVIALAPVVAAGIRVWMYSGGDVSVFLVLLRTLDIPAALIASAVLLVPTLILLTAVILFTDWRARDWFSRTLERNTWIAPIFPILFFIVIYTGNIVFAIGAAFIVVDIIVYFIIKRFWSWGHKHINQLLIAPRGDPNGPASVLTIIAVLTIFLVVPGNMWLPEERVEQTDSPPVVGYVLESGEVWTTLLTSDRQIEVVPTADVEERAVCRPSGPVSLATLIFPSNLRDAPNCTTPNA